MLKKQPMDSSSSDTPLEHEIERDKNEKEAFKELEELYHVSLSKIFSKQNKNNDP